MTTGGNVRTGKGDDKSADEIGKGEEERVLEEWRQGHAEEEEFRAQLQTELQTVHAGWRTVVLVNKHLRAIVRRNPTRRHREEGCFIVPLSRAKEITPATTRFPLGTAPVPGLLRNHHNQTRSSMS